MASPVVNGTPYAAMLTGLLLVEAGRLRRMCTWPLPHSWRMTWPQMPCSASRSTGSRGQISLEAYPPITSTPTTARSSPTQHSPSSPNRHSSRGIPWHCACGAVCGISTQHSRPGWCPGQAATVHTPPSARSMNSRAKTSAPLHLAVSSSACGSAHEIPAEPPGHMVCRCKQRSTMPCKHVLRQLHNHHFCAYAPFFLNMIFCADVAADAHRFHVPAPSASGDTLLNLTHTL